jgi:hypothetical protein
MTSLPRRRRAKATSAEGRRRPPADGPKAGGAEDGEAADSDGTAPTESRSLPAHRCRTGAARADRGRPGRAEVNRHRASSRSIRRKPSSSSSRRALATQPSTSSFQVSPTTTGSVKSSHAPSAAMILATSSWCFRLAKWLSVRRVDQTTRLARSLFLEGLRSSRLSGIRWSRPASQWKSS